MTLLYVKLLNGLFVTSFLLQLFLDDNKIGSYLNISNSHARNGIGAHLRQS